MYEYKVFNWGFDLNTSDDLEDELNRYANDGWRVFKIIPKINGGGTLIASHIGVDKATIVLERVKES